MIISVRSVLRFLELHTQHRSELIGEQIHALYWACCSSACFADSVLPVFFGQSIQESRRAILRACGIAAQVDDPGDAGGTNANAAFTAALPRASSQELLYWMEAKFLQGKSADAERRSVGSSGSVGGSFG